MLADGEVHQVLRVASSYGPLVQGFKASQPSSLQQHLQTTTTRK